MRKAQYHVSEPEQIRAGYHAGSLPRVKCIMVLTSDV